MTNQPSWMTEEESRAEELAQKGETFNNQAPQLGRVYREPPRMQKAFYLQSKYAEAFQDFAYKQKKTQRRKAPELIEEAIKMLLEKYGEDTKNL